MSDIIGIYMNARHLGLYCLVQIHLEVQQVPSSAAGASAAWPLSHGERGQGRDLLS
jgi:hypothetical protein